MVLDYKIMKKKTLKLKKVNFSSVQPQDHSIPKFLPED